MQTQEAKNTCDNKPNENKTIGVLSLVKSFAPNIIFTVLQYSSVLCAFQENVS